MSSANSPRLTALGAADQRRLEFLADVREMVSGERRFFATRDHLAVLLEALDATQADLAALGGVCDAQQVELIGFRDDLRVAEATLARERAYSARVEERNSALNEALIAANNRVAAASREVEQLLITAAIDLQATTAHFNRIRGLRETLDPSATDVPRMMSAL